MKKIPLTKGKFALVDDEDFDHLNQWKWYYSAIGYAVRDVHVPKGKKVCVYMHRQINMTPEHLRTDHINRNKLDNRKENLRAVDGSQNGINRGLNTNNTSGHKGVVWHKDSQNWGARIKLHYKTIYLGRYKELKDAIRARKKAELKYHAI